MGRMQHTGLRWLGVAGLVALLAACGKEPVAPAPPAPTDTSTSAAPPAAATTDATVAAADSAGPAADATAGTLTPEALEQLAAPIALYPDVILGHVLTAATNPQEVLDAGNWLLEHQDLDGAALDDAASKLGMSPSMRALLQFPETVDMMCMKLDWTTQLGQAFTTDQAGVLDAVQRLRAQAKDVGNLASGGQLEVKTETQQGKEVVTVAPADPKVVYVPKYDPVAVYAPAPATIPPPTTVAAPPPGMTTTTTTTTTTGPAGTVSTPATTTTTPAASEPEDKGHSTGTLITTGLLAFGAGILVNEVFDDDDDWDDYYPNYYHGGIYYGSRPYYPPPPYMYRPPYGGGYYPAHGYTRPPNYQHGFNNNTIIINNGGNSYWNDFDKASPRVTQTRAKSPITQARPNRPELAELNRAATDRARAPADRTARNAAVAGAAGAAGAAGVYKGATAAGREQRERMVENSPRATDRPGAASPGARDAPRRPQGEYAGAKNRPASSDRDASRPAQGAVQREAARPRPATGVGDRGREVDDGPARETPRPERIDRPATSERPAAIAERSRDLPQTERPAAPMPRAEVGGHARGSREHATAFDGAGRSAAAERSASQRGRASVGGGANRPARGR
ncbi:MAG TPA: DUF3300 domain-containing protein [Steroidobacteraceae bacterium]|nr:DUF3300 domain-containing protein [Steroidobacteraceae bacterium]